jgi:dipeptidyl aminopeptidase/acylaminoacyl peptidase
LGFRSSDATAIYVDDTNTGTFLRMTKPGAAPRTSVLSFNTYFREVSQPKRTMLSRKFDDGTLRLAELQLPVGHKPGMRHPVIVYAYPNFQPSLHSSVSQANNDLSTIYPIQYLLSKGFAFCHVPFPISGRNSMKPMYAAAEAVTPWLDVLDRHGAISSGEYGFWGHSNAGFVALALEALTDRFKAEVARLFRTRR